MNKQIKTAVCPVCHGTGCIGTTDWLTRGIDKEKLAKERKEALAEYEAQKKRDVAREIFAEIEKEILSAIDNNLQMMAKQEDANELWRMCVAKKNTLCGIYDFIAEVKKKYESEGAE